MFAYARKKTLLPLMVFLASVRGDILQYNASSRELYIRCPGALVTRGDVLFIKLIRNKDNMPLANWTQSDSGIVMYNRASLRPAVHPHLLEVVLPYVTCYDVTMYTCSMIVNGYNGPSSVINQSEPFTFGGEVTDPVLRMEPVQARYHVGGSLRLTCSASIGTPNNSIVWESRLPGDNFTIVTGDCDKGTNITGKHSDNPKSGSCGVTAVSSLTRVLTSHDDSREFRCRLKNTNHYAAFAVAVQCTDGAGCTQPCQPSTGQPNKTALPSKDGVASSPQTTEHPKAMALKGIAPSDGPVESWQSFFILIGVISILVVIIMLINIVIMRTMLKKHAKKQLGPLILTPPPSESPYNDTHFSMIRTRSLPQLPTVLDHYTTTQDALTNPHLQRLRGGNGEVQTMRKMYGPASSSVYVSMTAIPSLHEDPKADHSPREETAALPPLHEFRRSESIYSNGREACNTDTTKFSNGSVESRDVSSRESHVTMGNLKGWM